MYQLLTAEGGVAEDRIFSRVGKVLGTHFALYGEFDENLGEVVIRFECMLGRDEGSVQRSVPIPLIAQGEGIGRQWIFVRSLRLPPGVWKISAEDSGAQTIPGRSRIVRIEDRP